MITSSAQQEDLTFIYYYTSMQQINVTPTYIHFIYNGLLIVAVVLVMVFNMWRHTSSRVHTHAHTQDRRTYQKFLCSFLVITGQVLSNIIPYVTKYEIIIHLSIIFFLIDIYEPTNRQRRSGRQEGGPFVLFPTQFKLLSRVPVRARLCHHFTTVAQRRVYYIYGLLCLPNTKLMLTISELEK